MDCVPSGGRRRRSRPTRRHSSRDGLKGARIGVLRQAYERDTHRPGDRQGLHGRARRIRRAGAIIVDPAPVPLDEHPADAGAGPCGGFKYDINRYLAGHGDRVPVKSLADIIKSRRFHPTVAAPARAGAGGSRERTATPGVPGGSRVPPAGTQGGDDGDGYATAGGIRLSDLEQPAAPDRRSEYAARRQQPVLLADHGLPRRSRCRWATRAADNSRPA